MRYELEDARALLQVMRNRRDVRGNRFRSQEIEPEKLEMILQAALSAPSVGFSQPWRFVVIDDADVKEQVYGSFSEENEKAKAVFKERDLYRSLKLEGIREAPLNIAVLYEPSDEPVLGQTSMEQMGEYSVVCAVQNMWLMARTLNIGMGWVSIVDEAKVLENINAPENAKLIAYLCVGYVDGFAEKPELQSLGWADAKAMDDLVNHNSCGTRKL